VTHHAGTKDRAGSSEEKKRWLGDTECKRNKRNHEMLRTAASPTEDFG